VNGELSVNGRLKDLIIVRGVKPLTAYIEATIEPESDPQSHYQHAALYVAGINNGATYLAQATPRPSDTCLSHSALSRSMVTAFPTAIYHIYSHAENKASHVELPPVTISVVPP